MVKLRAREEPQGATVRTMPAGADVRLDGPALPAPGQACVFYDGDRVLGGGFIRREDRRRWLTERGGQDYLPCPSDRMAA